MSMVTAEWITPPPPDCEVRADCPIGRCGITHWHWTLAAFRDLHALFLTFS